MCCSAASRAGAGGKTGFGRFAGQQFGTAQDFAHGCEREVVQQAGQPAGTTCQVGVVAKRGQGSNFDPGLLGVQLPGMQVEREGTSGALIYLPQTRIRQPIGLDAEEAAT